MPFECKHCGQCCIDECTQINLSLGDIVRICKFLNCSMSEIMQKIGIKPFADNETANHYDYELGLNIPCEFREDGKCSIYPARPLNCRMFPYLFLGNVEKDQLKTEKFYEMHNMKQSNILPAYIFPEPDPNDPMHAKEITKSKIKMAMSMMNPAQYTDLKNQLQNFILRVESDITHLEEINAKEKEILP